MKNNKRIIIILSIVFVLLVGVSTISAANNTTTTHTVKENKIAHETNISNQINQKISDNRTYKNLKKDSEKNTILQLMDLMILMD